MVTVARKLLRLIRAAGGSPGNQVWHTAASLPPPTPVESHHEDDVEGDEVGDEHVRAPVCGV